MQAMMIRIARTELFTKPVGGELNGVVPWRFMPLLWQ
jgi:hypothetical protein